MKNEKIVSLVLIMIIMISGLFVLTGCDNNKDVEEKKNVDNYEMDTPYGKLSFELAKDTGYEFETYTDYKTFEVSGMQAFSVRTSNNFEYRIGILLDQYDKDYGLNHGLSIVVSQNATKTDEFDTKAFVESDVFQDLLNSIKFSAKQ